MSYRISGKDVYEGSKKVAIIKDSEEIRDDRNILLMKIKQSGSDYEIRDHRNSVIGKLTSSGDIKDKRNSKVGSLKDAKKQFNHPDDRVCSALYLHFAA